MKRLVYLLVGIVFFGSGVSAQYSHQSLNEIDPPADFENIHVTSLGGDSLSSAFLIWVKSEVPLHYHAFHSENIVVLEGSGIMQIGKETIPLTTGDHLFIPATTPHSVQVQSPIPLKVLSIQSPEFDGTDRISVD